MRKILVCNQKMFLTYDEANVLKEKIDNIDISNIDLIICPSYLNFSVFNNYTLGAQDCFYEDKGSYTGEISAYDLHLRGICYSIIGHSDRRKYDTNEIINKKVKSCLKNSITPIICIGETRMDKELRKTSEVLKKQVITALKDVNLEAGMEIIIAYEPVWAIGGTKGLSKDIIEDTLEYIRRLLNQIGIDNYKLLYGGSVNSSNINMILSDKVDGYLLGNASIDSNELQKIIKSIK